jgi:hypothetical protein
MTRCPRCGYVIEDEPETTSRDPYCAALAELAAAGEPFERRLERGYTEAHRRACQGGTELPTSGRVKGAQT